MADVGDIDGIPLGEEDEFVDGIATGQSQECENDRSRYGRYHRHRESRSRSRSSERRRRSRDTDDRDGRSRRDRRGEQVQDDWRHGHGHGERSRSRSESERSKGRSKRSRSRSRDRYRSRSRNDDSDYNNSYQREERHRDRHSTRDRERSSYYRDQGNNYYRPPNLLELEVKPGQGLDDNLDYGQQQYKYNSRNFNDQRSGSDSVDLDPVRNNHIPTADGARIHGQHWKDRLTSIREAHFNRTKRTSQESTQNQFRNDGSFMEMFRQKMAQQSASGADTDKSLVTPNSLVLASSSIQFSPGLSLPPLTESAPDVLPQKSVLPDEDVDGAPMTRKKAVPVPVSVGKRRLTKPLKTGIVFKKQPKPEEGEASQERLDAWSTYLKEVQKYKTANCIDDDVSRPLVK